MAALTFQQDNVRETIEVKEGRTLLDVLQEQKIVIAFPCNGNHRCGKCRVTAAGQLSPISEKEAALLVNAPDHTRLACFAVIEGDTEVEIEPRKSSSKVALDFELAEYRVDPIYAGDYGAAIDIGTTTVAAYLYSRDSMHVLESDGSPNWQQRYGADVLSRIDYANRNGVVLLKNAIRVQIGNMLKDLCHHLGIENDQLSTAVITGNTTMLHLLEGLEPRALAMAPFTVQSNFGYETAWRLDPFPDLAIYLPYSISAYVGSDITCSMLAAGFEYVEQNTLLIDIGTNGEMALKSNGQILCCSTAAGPAFEGTGIKNGMPAKAGAIYKVWIENGSMKWLTIGDADPVGICGSGLIDAVSAACKLGIINSRGKITQAGIDRAFAVGDSGILIHQSDVRELQMGKGAIRAGIDTLLDMQGMTDADVAELLLCGGFGSFLDPQTAAGIGMIPSSLAARCRAIGNAAGAGASLILQSREAERVSERLGREAVTVELSLSKSFSQNYLKAMYFPEQGQR